MGKVTVLSLFAVMMLVGCSSISSQQPIQSEQVSESILESSLDGMKGNDAVRTTALYLLCESITRGKFGSCFFELPAMETVAPGELKSPAVTLAAYVYDLGARMDRRAQFDPAFYFYRCALMLDPSVPRYREAYLSLAEELDPHPQRESIQEGLKNGDE